MHIYNQLLDQITEALKLKGYHDPEASLTFRDPNGWSAISCNWNWQTDANARTEYASVRHSNLSVYDDTTDVEAYVRVALEKISEMPSVHEVRIKAFVNSLERLKAEAGDLGLDADFVNPLAAIMEKLASNALPAPKL